MPTLNWSDELSVNQVEMDATHKEFVELLGRLEAALGDAPSDAPSDALLDAVNAFVEHTTEHFALEERWMAACGYAAENCHSHQHRLVLGVLKEIDRGVRQGGVDTLRQAIPDIAAWFSGHAQMMDTALAWHMQKIGFDPGTGCATLAPHSGEPITGCGNAGCA